jgi:hypothetical protein
MPAGEPVRQLISDPRVGFDAILARLIERAGQRATWK